MAILVILGFALVGTVELVLSPRRPWKEVAAYLVLLAVAAAFSFMVTLNPDLPVPQPLGLLFDWLKEIWQGGL